MSVDLKKIEGLLKLAKQYRLTEFSIEDGKTKISFRTRLAHSGVAMVTEGRARLEDRQFSGQIGSAETLEKTNQNVEAFVDRKEQPKEMALPDGAMQITSPFVGTFYRAPSPDSAPYVKDGQTVKKGDVLCIVEAMKLMNEIESEWEGTIVSCLVENGQPVEYGEPLFLLEPK